MMATIACRAGVATTRTASASRKISIGQAVIQHAILSSCGSLRRNSLRSRMRRFGNAMYCSLAQQMERVAWIPNFAASLAALATRRTITGQVAMQHVILTSCGSLNKTSSRFRTARCGIVMHCRPRQMAKIACFPRLAASLAVLATRRTSIGPVAMRRVRPR